MKNCKNGHLVHPEFITTDECHFCFKERRFRSEYNPAHNVQVTLMENGYWKALWSRDGSYRLLASGAIPKVFATKIVGVDTPEPSDVSALRRTIQHAIERHVLVQMKPDPAPHIGDSYTFLLACDLDEQLVHQVLETILPRKNYKSLSMKAARWSLFLSDYPDDPYLKTKNVVVKNITPQLHRIRGRQQLSPSDGVQFFPATHRPATVVSGGNEEPGIVYHPNYFQFQRAGRYMVELDIDDESYILDFIITAKAVSKN